METRLWTLVVGLVFLAAPVSGGSVEDFYKGKTIRIVVGYGPGGATDTNARLLQKALSKHIPGNPNIVVENKPGGGSMLAANSVYSAEPADGTVIAAFASDLALQQAMGATGVRFDAANISGSVALSTHQPCARFVWIRV